MAARDNINRHTTLRSYYDMLKIWVRWLPLRVRLRDLRLRQSVPGSGLRYLEAVGGLRAARGEVPRLLHRILPTDVLPQPAVRTV